MIVGKRSLFVDTSGWIEVFGKDRPFHKQAKEILSRAVKELRPIITTNYVISEFIGRGGKACSLSRSGLFKAVEDISKLPGSEIIHIGEEVHAYAIVYLRGRMDKEWSLVDATSFIIMERFRITEALATDHHFEQARFIKLL